MTTEGASKHTPVFTVGYEKTYDAGIALYGRAFVKQGRTAEYGGGYAVRSFAEAQMLIDEQVYDRGWAVYELEADWDLDTVPSNHGWWHALMRDAVVLRKVTDD